MQNSILYQKKIARKHLGQYFLQDKKIIEKIISDIDPKVDQELIEIGPGLGALTEPISQYIHKMNVIEIDLRLINFLKNTVFSSKINFFNQDVMKFNFNTFSKQKNKMLRIFGNLPYNISTKIIFYLLSYNQVIDDMHFMLQKDVADRLVSKPNKKTYGRLSIMAQSLSDISLISDTISPNAFIPVPKVQSTVVRIIPKKNILNEIDINILNQITIEAFSKRRKMIRNSLKKFFSADILNKLDISDNLRAENISVSKYCKLTNILKNKFLKNNRYL